ncbi:hypothetical protein N7495_001000 [Penicillium taxi]|uniref:uncharacterized protein n=1 Tax=Penicillium taxi TaxID=168475 RepID=UPI002544DD19|nr:uncharacterized protein N7495_001000 [Penicillium taxi]KAJ5908318.1 hypothetical protein N7495_001000 [Penicillium taxi]
MDNLNIYVLTANCARTVIDVDLFSKHIFDALPTSDVTFSPALIALSLQEIAPIAYSFLGESYLDPYFDAFNQAVKQATSKRWRQPYVNVVQDHTGMTALMVFARADVTDQISWIDNAHVGFGVQEMGNKGAVGARLGYMIKGQKNTVDVTFVAAHLAPMEDALEQRNLDWKSIVERLVFSQEGSDWQNQNGFDGEALDEATVLLRDQGPSHRTKGRRTDLFAPNAYLFLAGDLNYRTSSKGPEKEDVARFPRLGVDRNHSSHYSNLFREDQLRREMQHGRSFHGLSEAPVDFPPTYKYSDAARKAAPLNLENGQPEAESEWIWSNHRWPSWCDRILYLDSLPRTGEGRGVNPHVYTALPLFPQSDHRPVALSVSIPLNPSHLSPETEQSDVRAMAPFAIDPGWKSRRDAARRKEVVVGLLAYLGLTWEGNGLLFASILVTLGAWVSFSSLWEA